MTDHKGIGAFYLPGLIPVDEWPGIDVGHEGACGWRRYVPERTCENVSEEPDMFRCSACGFSCDFSLSYCGGCGARVVEG